MTEGGDKHAIEIVRSADGRCTTWVAPSRCGDDLARWLQRGEPLHQRVGAEAVALGGRGVPLRVPAPGGTLLAKRLARGGIHGRIVRGGFASPARLEAAVQLQQQLEAVGAPVAPFAFARALKHGGRFTLEFATVELTAARDAAARFSESSPRRERRSLLRAAGAAVRALHRAGALHRDLNAKNVLLARDPPRAWLIDFDGSPPPGAPVEPHDPRAVGNLARLLRSAEKKRLWSPDGGRPAPLEDRDLIAFLRGYLPEPAGRFRRSTLRRAVVLAWKRTIGWHRLAWRLFGRAP
jgi:hypothetical protein